MSAQNAKIALYYPASSTGGPIDIHDPCSEPRELPLDTQRLLDVGQRLERESKKECIKNALRSYPKLHFIAFTF